VQIHVCVCEECLYFGANKELNYCPICNEPRYLQDTAAYKSRHGKKRNNKKNTPRKVLRYFPIADRLKQLFNHPIYSRFFTYDQYNIKQREKKNEKEVMEDIHHAPIWDDFKNDLPTYKEKGEHGVCDKRVAFIMTADSASMSSFNAADFSLTPFILSILNWPIAVRTKRNHLLYTCITPINNKQTFIYFRNN
jgi:hypothetical protein